MLANPFHKYDCNPELSAPATLSNWAVNGAPDGGTTGTGMVVATGGSVENLALLRDPKSGVDIALVQGGSVGKVPGELESLGTLFYEPLWIFHRSGLEGATLAALRGRKVSIGPVGSGSHALLLRLLKLNEMDQGVAELLRLPPPGCSQ